MVAPGKGLSKDLDSIEGSMKNYILNILLMLLFWVFVSSAFANKSAYISISEDTFKTLPAGERGLDFIDLVRKYKNKEDRWPIYAGKSKVVYSNLFLLIYR